MSAFGIATSNLENLNRAGLFFADGLNDAAYHDDKLGQKTGWIGRILHSQSGGERGTAFYLPPGP